MAKRLFQIVSGTLAGLAALALASVAGWLPGRAGAPPDPHVLATPFPAPELRLTGPSREPFDLASPGGPAVVFFGYTHCPDVCPLAHLRSARVALGDGVAPVQVVFVTVDPARDTPERLASYLESFQPGFSGLTGTEEAVAAALAAWGIYRGYPAGETDYVVDHTARSFVVDERGLVRATFPPDADVDAIAATLRSVFRSR
jgi:protein SCO1/2